MAEKPNERGARHVVAQALGVPVSRYEDGSVDSQVDAVIHCPDGLEALEVVADHEEAFNAQWAALEKVNHRLHVPGLRQVWSVQLSRSAKVKEVVKALPSLMLALQDEPAVSNGAGMGSVAGSMAELGIRMVYPLEGTGSGHVNLHAEGWAGFASSMTMAQYVERILAAAPDVPYKLALHPAPVKHAFIWTTIGTDYGIQSQLERRGEQPLPIEPPSLPSGVTHVWVAGSFTSQGVLAWFPNRGWWRPACHWPEDQAMALTEDAGGIALPHQT